MSNLDFTLICIVKFFSKKRRTPPNLTSGKYYPHLVIKGDTEYLGVTFIDGEEVVFDKEIMKSMYKFIPTTKRILDNIDVMVDGRFEIDLLDLRLRFRGSSNQRIINVPESLKQNEVVLWDMKYGV